VDLPVKLKVHQSIFVPLAKWAMLLTGNYRCVQADGMRAIKDAVHSDLEQSREVYEWVVGLCVLLGATRDDMVPFDKYAPPAPACSSRPRPPVPWPPVRPTSSASTCWSSSWPSRRVCATPRSAKPSS